jgi:hypothetical protein
MYGCVTWSVILRVDYRLGIFNKMVLGKIIEHKRGRKGANGESRRMERTGEWRKPPKGERQDLIILYKYY